MKCPVCKMSDEVQRSRRGPTAMALDDVNPMQPFRCTRCWKKFWRPKDIRRFFFSSCLGLLVFALLVNAGIHVTAFVKGRAYRTADRTKLFVNLDPSIKCPKCGKSNISRSTLQPKGRTVAWLNPFTPYRCWDCWKRFWRLKPPLEAATNLVLLTLVVLVVVRGVRRGRQRMNDAVENVAIQL